MKPRLLDLFSGAGGAAAGYAAAGFEVVGVDNRPQPRYPFEFVMADALEFISQHGAGFDVIHASPPCQAYTHTAASRKLADHPDLLAPTRTLLRQIGRPYVIENVSGATMPEAFVLCGSSFGLPIVRHRKFEVWPPGVVGLVPSTCGQCSQASGHGPGYYPYADGTWEPAWREHVVPVVWPWMTTREAGQAIPPAYTQWIGEQLLVHLAATVPIGGTP